jgi:hypothetical protein
VFEVLARRILVNPSPSITFARKIRCARRPAVAQRIRAGRIWATASGQSDKLLPDAPHWHAPVHAPPRGFVGAFANFFPLLPL